MSTPFPSYSILATGSTTPATDPDRRARDILNALDWTADPTGKRDTTADLQKVIDYAYLNIPNPTSGFFHGARIYVPPGTYLIGSPPLRISAPVKVSGAFTSAPTSSGNVLTFAAGDLPAWLSNGLNVFDLTTVAIPPVIPVGTTISSFTATTVTLSAPVTGGGVLAGDLIQFSPGILGQVTIEFVGSGRDATILKGNYSTGSPAGTDPGGYIVCSENIFTQPDGEIGLSQPCALVSDMTIWNQSTVDYSGALNFVSGDPPKQVLRRLRLIGINGLRYSDSLFSGHVENCIALCSRVYSSPFAAPVYQTADQHVPYDPNSSAIAPRAKGFWISQGVFQGNWADGFDFGFAVSGDQGSGNACFVHGNRATRCKIGYTSGLGAEASGSGNIASGTTLLGNYANRCQVGIYARNATGAAIIANTIDGYLGPADAASISAMVWNGSNTVTVTTSVPHNLSGTPTIQLRNINPVGFIPAANIIAGSTGNVSVTVTGASTFTYALTVNPGGSFVSGGWAWPQQSGISAQGLVGQMGANSFPGVFSYNSVDFDNLGADGVSIRSSAFAMHGQSGWVPPTTGGGGTEWQAVFTNSCSGPNVPLSFLTFSQLPSAGTFGLTFNITDGQKSGGGTALFGDLVAGGGTQHIKVIDDGTNWRRCA